MNERSFKYKQKIWLGPVAIVLFGYGANFFLERAQNPTGGLTINRIIELSPEAAGYFHWFGCGFSVLMVFGGFLTLLNSLRRTQYVVLGLDSIKAPRHTFSSTIVEIPFRSITAMKLQQVQKQLFLHIEHANGKLSLLQSSLPSKADFDEICQYLAERVRR
jgi:hypothetical protein